MDVGNCLNMILMNTLVEGHPQGFYTTFISTEWQKITRVFIKSLCQYLQDDITSFIK